MRIPANIFCFIPAIKFCCPASLQLSWRHKSFMREKWKEARKKLTSIFCRHFLIVIITHIPSWCVHTLMLNAPTNHPGGKVYNIQNVWFSEQAAYARVVINSSIILRQCPNRIFRTETGILIEIWYNFVQHWLAKWEFVKVHFTRKENILKQGYFDYTHGCKSCWEHIFLKTLVKSFVCSHFTVVRTLCKFEP